MNDRTADHSAWLFSFLAGGLTGASVALLLAPQSGKATRDAMQRKLRETTDSARDLKDRALRRGEEVRNEATRRIGVVAHEATRRVGAAAQALVDDGADAPAV
jgi:gas vesicle protein